MRILVVGAVLGGTVPVGRSIYRGFQEIGIESDLLDFSVLEGEFRELWAAQDEQRSYGFHIRKKVMLLERITSFLPDVILGIAQSPLGDTAILPELKKAGITLCYWFTEDYRIFEYWKTIAPWFDHFFTIQQEPFRQELKKAGCDTCRYLPMAFDPHADHPGETTGPEIAVSFVGAPYPNRVHFLSRFPGELEIYGEEWNRYPNPFVAVGDRRIAEDEARSIYRRSRININLHSSAFPRELGKGDFVNPRTFELAGMGCFQLTDMRTLLPLHFDPAREVLALSGWEEMTKAAEYFLAHERERAEMAEKARARVLREHTYRHRAEEIVALLEAGQKGTALVHDRVAGGMHEG